MVLSTAANIKAATSISKRADLDRWAKRAKTRRRFLITAYLFGAIPIYLMMVAAGINAAIQSGQGIAIGPIIMALTIGLIPGFCCFGPIVLLPCYFLINDGLRNYRSLISELRNQHRVCEICEAVALFDDKFVNPSKRKKHTHADLVPHMNVIHEDGEVNVLCDQCLAEVKAIDSDE